MVKDPLQAFRKNAFQQNHALNEKYFSIPFKIYFWGDVKKCKKESGCSIIKLVNFGLLYIDFLCLKGTKAYYLILFHIWFISLPSKWHWLDGSCKIPRSPRTEGNQAVNGQQGHIKSQVLDLSFITYAITFGNTMAHITSGAIDVFRDLVEHLLLIYFCIRTWKIWSDSPNWPAESHQKGICGEMFRNVSFFQRVEILLFG